MRIIGFNFNKIDIERFKDKLEKVKINTKVNIDELKESKNNFLKTKEELIEVKFNYSIDYDPDFAKIALNGTIILAVEPKLSKEIINQWKDKKMSDELRITLFNVIIRKSTVRALQLEEEMNLPLHISLPSVRKQEKEDKQE